MTSSMPSSPAPPSPTTWPGWPSWPANTATFVSGCGHVGDGNVHLAVFQPDPEKRHAIESEILRTAIDAGGAVSGEHGIGTAKLPFFLELEDPSALELMRAIKGVFDPKGILGPGRFLGGLHHPSRPTTAAEARSNQMNGARALLSTLVDAGVDVCFANPGHLRDALRGGARRRARHAGRPLPLRGSGHRRRRRLRQGGRATGRHSAPPRPGAGQRPGQPAQRPAGPHSDRQHRGRPRHVPHPLRRAARIRHRVHREAVSGWYRSTARADDVGGRRRRRRSSGLRASRVRRHAGAAGRRLVVRVVHRPEHAQAPCATCGRAPGHRRRGGQGSALRRADRTPPGRAGAPSRRPPRGQPGRRDHRCRIVRRDVPSQPRTWRRHPGRRKVGLPGRDGAGPTRRSAPSCPGRRQVTCVLLRLSRQSERPRPGRLHRAHVGPPRRGCGSGPRGPGGSRGCASRRR